MVYFCLKLAFSFTNRPQKANTVEKHSDVNINPIFVVADNSQHVTVVKIGISWGGHKDKSILIARNKLDVLIHSFFWRPCMLSA